MPYLLLSAGQDVPFKLILPMLFFERTFPVQKDRGGHLLCGAMTDGVAVRGSTSLCETLHLAFVDLLSIHLRGNLGRTKDDK